jgi:hypothetical protein
MAIASAQITGASPTTIYTSSGSNAVTCIWICNTATYDPNNPTTGLTYLDVHFVKSGDGVSNTNLVANQLPVPAGESVTFDTEKMILDTGDTVVLYSPSPYNLVATISTIPV